MHQPPFVSVITVCRNDRINLVSTAESLKKQICNDFEWVVIDAASVDGTVEYIRSIALERIVWTSEPDSGIYEAFNKGAALSRGAYVVYICAGDQIASSDTLIKVKEFIEQNPGGDIYYGDAFDVRAGEVEGRREARHHDTIWWNLFTHHQAMFYSRRCFELARYDATYRIGGDYAFTAELLHKGAVAIRMPLTTANFQIGGTSYRNYWLGEQENWRTRRELGVSLPARMAIWTAHAAIRMGRLYAPRLYRRFRYAQGGQRDQGTAVRKLAEERPVDFSLEGIRVRKTSLDEAADTITHKIGTNKAFSVFTLNLDHITKLRSDPEFCSAYRKAAMILPDGFPIAMAGRFALREPVERVCGSDLIAPLCERANRQRLSVFFYGTNADTLSICTKVLREEMPNLRIAGCLAPGMGFDAWSDETTRDIETIAKSGSDIVFVALGAPRGEIFAARLAERLPRGACISIGAGLDFIAGTQKRAPTIARRLGLEWLWRLAHDPRRLFIRYVKSLMVFPSVMLSALRTRSAQTD